MTLTPEQRSLRARVAAQSRWAKLNEEERREATQAAREAQLDRFDAEPNPEAARKAHMLRLALASSRKRKGG